MKTPLHERMEVARSDTSKRGDKHPCHFYMRVPPGPEHERDFNYQLMNEAEYLMKNYGDRGECYPSRP